jgi:predicted ester cyclase
MWCYNVFIIQLSLLQKGDMMSVEQVARDFVTTMLQNPEKLASMVTPDAMVDGGVLPQPVPFKEAMHIVEGLKTAIPDIHVDIQQVTVDGNKATLQTRWGGTQSHSLDLPVPGMQPIPVTGRAVSVKDNYIVTVQGDKVSHMTVVSPPDGGIPAALEQLGVRPPGM